MEYCCREESTLLHLKGGVESTLLHLKGGVESTLLHFKEGDCPGPWERISVATLDRRSTVIGESLR